MHRVALLLHSPLEPGGLSTYYRALMGAQELRDAGDDVVIVADGSGTAALAALLESTHRLSPLATDVRPLLRGACEYCARAYGVHAALHEAGVPMLGEHRGHASLRRLLDEGRQILTF